MSQCLPGDVFELDPAPRAPAPTVASRLRDLRGWLLLGMGLTGLLAVALVVTADSSYAGVDGVRAIRAIVPTVEAPDVSRIPFLGGIIGAIHDVAPDFFAPSPDAAGEPPPAAPAEAPSRPANSPSPRVQPSVSGLPAAQLPVSTTPPPAPTLSSRPSPTTPRNTSAPVVLPVATAAPTPTPSATPAPVLQITTDRGATAIVNVGDLVPGDTMDRTITVQNTGSLAFRYTVSLAQTASTALWTDTSDGLQVIVTTSGGTALYSGPVSGLGLLNGPTVLAPGTSELLGYS
ncbi:MAG: hypothetical protein M3Z65_07615, partial [Chloroflexota bacterium]|nr:hypothetical protein [Chloroflexota bacterium]